MTERATNNIDVFQVRADGTLAPIVVNTDSQPGAFSVSFAPNGAALVSETGPAGGSDASTISSYSVLANGTLSPISVGVATLGNANCWNAATPNGRWVYVSNAASSTIHEARLVIVIVAGAVFSGLLASAEGRYVVGSPEIRDRT